MLITDPGSGLSIPDSESGYATLNLTKNLIILTQDIINKLSEIRAADPDPDPGGQK
jgi:hypothetical protein